MHCTENCCSWLCPWTEESDYDFLGMRLFFLREVFMSEWNSFDLYNPTEEHKMLRDTVKQFVQSEVEPQAHEYDRKEEFNLPLFQKCGEMGLLGITTPVEFGGTGMDAVAATIVHEEISSARPG